MKKLSFLVFVALSSLFAFKAQAQADCQNARYYAPLFENVKTTLDIEFGKNIQPSIFNPNAVQTLYVDVYEPEGDTLTERPLIILAFGGAFVFGDRKSPDIVEFANRFAKIGYVVASVDYRLTTDIATQGNDTVLYKAVLKAVHDIKAGVRFFRKDRATDNTFRIDTSRIFLGGVSAGAVGALHAVYLDQESEIPPQMASDTVGVGGLEGLSGNPGYSSEAMGVINFCGALGDRAWIQPGDQMMVSLHGNLDDVVPYDRDTVTLFNLNTVVDGSSVLHPRLDSLSIPNSFYTWDKAGHTPFVDFSGVIPEYMDTAFAVSRDFLYEQLCGLAAGIEAPLSAKVSQAYPNPFHKEVTIELGTSIRNAELRLFDMMGRELALDMQKSASSWTLQRSNMPSGTYYYQAVDMQGKWQASGRLLAQ